MSWWGRNRRDTLIALFGSHRRTPASFTTWERYIFALKLVRL
jgi:hypothetical protein